MSLESVAEDCLTFGTADVVTFAVAEQQANWEVGIVLTVWRRLKSKALPVTVPIAAHAVKSLRILALQPEMLDFRYFSLLICT